MGKTLSQAPRIVAHGKRNAGAKVVRVELWGPFARPRSGRRQTWVKVDRVTRGKQCGKGDKQPAGALLLPVEVNVGTARQTLYRRGDHFAYL
ncbi:hypothetical protein CSC88_39050, partial [Klebsiella pneumoniae]